MIYKGLTTILAKKLHIGKVIVLIGPRQVGKTTIINTLLADNDYLFLDGGDYSVPEIISNANTVALKSIIGTFRDFEMVGKS